VPGENVDVVRAQFEHASRREWDAVMGLYADDVVLALHGELRSVGGEGAVGKQAVGEWFGQWFSTFDRDYRFEIHEVRELADGRVFIDATHHGRGRASGVPISKRTGWVYEVRDGRIVRCDAYPDRESAQAAADAAG
jgi:ketosteroid isomerase-like protein